ncbi:hypothetical protein COS93_01355 [bacterium (Candidatus Gribaldobacteria) CG07_land_8_20_14_0_80_33_18]|uniref:Uncharacterized protein n=2 Tax=Bacteria candidate phyla TaxID=1783234 RepID=A0A2M6Z3F5_9BACT|nr:MAG: hypothetical protein COW98_03105 [Candidatus Roizmanbacteria bacterium CG22_combo_CG10-13_8_21_14_all_35_9]PIR89994.1 MAG: hypothetical protein COU04_00985 [bacterium (Candidatus Gribaldobacteria) CG10_big_fil_rev_8_21_14_0_10_33_41]PIU46939.1 MAG: hypothetical protein COS93_01355 [bacterium (Candidatus Gribaldobacteria) CG07_land_8_20_14_0_80_33_18]PJA01278.1 MAG: hypothetical protein COX75_00235 [bacterium (Candidatus Gribaldobacteria) CG_4_10_14_0_2_um_filter_33_15]PJB08635.1 MAG: hy
MKRIVIVLVLIFVLFGIKTTEAAKVWTKKGDVIIGEIVEMTEEKLVIKTRFGIIELLKKDVEKIEEIEKGKKEKELPQVKRQLKETKKEAKIGLGVNWLGFQTRYKISEKWAGEAKISFADNNWTLGGRGYYFLKEIPGNIPVLLYSGGEFGLIFSTYLTGGLLTGGFVGSEFLINQHVGLNGDLGLYLVGLWSRIGSCSDIGVILNFGVIYYF